MTWPSFFPSASCPPDDALPVVVQVFRLVRGDTVGSNDLLPWRQEFPDRPADDECIACGVSVYDDRTCVEKLRKKVGAFKGRRIATGTLDEASGVSKPTPSNRSRSHRTWWMPDGFDPSPRFSVVEEGE